MASMTWKGNAEELDTMVRRVTRVRLAGVEKAAELEGILTESLRKWMKREKFPLTVPTD